MKLRETAWAWLRSRFAALRRLHLALALRVTLAAIVSLVVAQAVSIPLPLWTVLTAVIVTQMSVGRSLKASADYMMGTIGGAIYGGLVAIVIPHQSEWALLIVLFIAVAPLALFAATRANMNVVPITAIIVLLVPTITHTTPFYSAVSSSAPRRWRPRPSPTNPGPPSFAPRSRAETRTCGRIRRRGNCASRM